MFKQLLATFEAAIAFLIYKNGFGLLQGYLACKSQNLKEVDSLCSDVTTQIQSLLPLSFFHFFILFENIGRSFNRGFRSDI
jgi:hypothetical protein